MQIERRDLVEERAGGRRRAGGDGDTETTDGLGYQGPHDHALGQLLQGGVGRMLTPSPARTISSTADISRAWKATSNSTPARRAIGREYLCAAAGTSE